MQTERKAGLETQAFIRVHGESALGFPGWAGLINSNQKSRVLVNTAGVSCKGHKKGRQWEAGETTNHKGCWESHIRNFHSLVSLQAAV